MESFERVSEEARESLARLAGLTRDQLELAGIPAHLWRADASRQAGAEVVVDSGDDAAGGVYVLWQISDDLSRTVSESVRGGRLGDPVVAHASRLKTVMHEAVMRVLESAGFEVRVGEYDMAPSAVQVLSGPR
ncbi:hypothetical protein E1265_26890 [Streptomyces sp. 8K308]|uniref:hypothetical protein n=1 Tax=Streptomyces sp. 8K308 TaxID=2530388 RepID=UPI0010511B29|nr:hypothetical protein [Streptomyces sp. 8K308]TDC15318.1 hypothetical protein E1265_26890 [Streptomyces sp. 8K308]